MFPKSQAKSCFNLSFEYVDAYNYPIVLPLLDHFGAPLLHDIVVDFSPPSLDCYLNQSHANKIRTQGLHTVMVT